jgi:hypothetical protein
MPVIVYRAKNYQVDGEPAELTHKIYPDGEIKTVEKTNDYFLSITRWQKDGNLYVRSYLKDDFEIECRTYKNNELHSEDYEPAVSRTFDDYTSNVQKWYKDGKLHRTNGNPAIVEDYENDDVYKRYNYFEGELISEYSA